MVCAVIRSFDVNPTNSLNSFSLIILIQMMRSSCSAPCGLQQGIVGTPPVMGLIQEDVEGLLIDSSFGELHLGDKWSVTQEINNDILTTYCSCMIEDSSVWEIYLCLLLLCRINNGGAAHFSNLAPLAIK